jgi:hypothetical protein
MLAAYKRWLVIGGVCATVAYVALFVDSLISGDFALALFCASVVVFWWISGGRVRRDLEDSLVLSLLAILLAWLPMRALFTEWIGANHVGAGGSPLDFAIAPAFALLILLPVTIALALGVYLKVSEIVAASRAVQPRTVLDRYRRWFAFNRVLVSCAYGYFLIGCLMSSLFAWAAFSSALIAFWWLSGRRLAEARKHSIVLTLSAVLLAWLPMAWLLAKRIHFMKRFGFEGPHGEGSPMAFLIGLAGQLLIFFPITVTLALGVYAWIVERIQARKPNNHSATRELP